MPPHNPHCFRVTLTIDALDFPNRNEMCAIVCQSWFAIHFNWVFMVGRQDAARTPPVSKMSMDPNRHGELMAFSASLAKKPSSYLNGRRPVISQRVQGAYSLRRAKEGFWRMALHCRVGVYEPTRQQCAPLDAGWDSSQSAANSKNGVTIRNCVVLRVTDDD